MERKPEDHLGEYSEANIAFHKQIGRLGKCQSIIDTTDDLFTRRPRDASSDEFAGLCVNNSRIVVRIESINQ
jgi:hypothetical protein